MLIIIYNIVNLIYYILNGLLWLSSTGLNDINANNIASDNIAIYSNLNVSGLTILIDNVSLYDIIIHNFTTLLSALNVIVNSLLRNQTTILASLNVSGYTT